MLIKFRLRETTDGNTSHSAVCAARMRFTGRNVCTRHSWKSTMWFCVSVVGRVQIVWQICPFFISVCVSSLLYFVWWRVPLIKMFTRSTKSYNRVGLKYLHPMTIFIKSLTCTACGIKLTYQDGAKAMWLIKWHAGENSHKVKSGWYLDANNKVLSSKPKGMDSV